MRIGILGAGSLGSMLAGRLAAAGTDVAVLGRANDHLERISADGITVITPDRGELVGPVDASSDPRILSRVDAVLVCVKSYDTEQAISVVTRYLTADTDVVTLQNGLGNAETIADHVPEQLVIAGTTTQGATLAEPGRVRHAGGGETYLGRYFTANDDTVEALAETLTKAGIDTSTVRNIRDTIWEKMLVNTGINAATALARVPNGELTDGPGERVLRTAVQEGTRVADADGRAIPSDIVERALDVAERTATNESSMRQDIESGSRTEIDSLNAEIVRRAEVHGLSVPVNRTLTDLVKLAERRS